MEIQLIIVLGKLAYWFFLVEVSSWLLECAADLMGWDVADLQIKRLRSIGHGCVALYFGSWVFGSPFL